MKTPIPRLSWVSIVEVAGFEPALFKIQNFLLPTSGRHFDGQATFLPTHNLLIRVIVVARDCVDKGENYDDSNPIEPTCIISWRVVTFCDMFQKKNRAIALLCFHIRSFARF